MSTETKALAVVPRSIDEVTDLAERFSKSTLLPASMRGKMPDVLVTIMAGQEMGLPPMASLRAIHVIEGKPVLSADGMIAVILGSGKAEYFERVEESDIAVTYETKRKGSTRAHRCTWTIEMAKKAALHLKDNWRAYPRAMLASRAKSELARDVYPDVLAGCYTEDEAQGFAAEAAPATPLPTRHHDVIDVEIVSETTAEIAAIEAAQSPQELMGLLKQLAAMPNGAAKKTAREKYGAKMKKFEEEQAATVIAVDPAPINGTETAS